MLEGKVILCLPFVYTEIQVVGDIGNKCSAFSVLDDTLIDDSVKLPAS